MPKKITPGDAAVARELFSGIKYVLLDIDGVLWSGDSVIPGVPDALAALRTKLGCQLRFITNNATMSREQMVRQKFHHFGLTDVREAEVLSSAYAARVALRALAQPRGSLFDLGNILVLGNAGLHDELRPSLAPGRFTYGLELHRPHEQLLSAIGPYNMKSVARCWDEPLLPAPSTGPLSAHASVTLKDLDIAAVVIGLDFHFTPTTLALASMTLQRHDRVAGASKALFVATNKDPQISIGDQGWLLPGGGSLVTALEYASGRQPDMVCGKPHTALFDMFVEAEREAGVSVSASECLMVGDRLSTDIAFGNAAGARTLFVLSGCETEADVAAAEGTEADSSLIPHYVADSLWAAVSTAL